MSVNETTKAIILDMLENPTLEVQMFRGMKETTQPEDADASYEPTGGKTVVLKINGGSNNVEIVRVKIEGDDGA